MQIVWEGNWMSPNGHATVARNMARALSRQGCEVRLVSRQPVDPSRYRALLDPDLLAMARRPAADPSETIRILHRVPTDFQRGPERFTIGMTYTEATNIPPKWAQAVNREVDALVLACNQSARVARRAGVKCPIWVIPQGVDTTTFRPRTLNEQDAFELPEFRFLSVFEWAIRKGYDALLQAFWSEFRNTDDVCLVIKTRYFGKSSIQGEIEKLYTRHLKGQKRRAVGARPIRAKSVGAKSVGAKSVGAKSVGAKSVGAKSVGAKSVGAKSVGAKSGRGVWRLVASPWGDAKGTPKVLRFSPPGKAPVYVVNGVLPDEDLGQLYRHCSAFVLPTRGEGIGLPLLEAAATGLPLIVTGWGGQMDFLHREDAYIVDYRMQPIPERFRKRWASLRGLWAEPGILSLRRQMRHLYNRRNKVSERAVRQQQHVITNWNWDACASQLIAKLEAVLGKSSLH